VGPAIEVASILSPDAKSWLPHLEPEFGVVSPKKKRVGGHALQAPKKKSSQPGRQTDRQVGLGFWVCSGINTMPYGLITHMCERVGLP